MDGPTKTFILISTLLISVTSVTGDFNVPEVTNGRIQTQPGKRCFMYHWDVQNLNQSCVYPDCNFTLSIRLFKGSGPGVTVEKHDILSKQARRDNSSNSYSECLYDSSSGQNISCCKSMSPELTSGQSVPFSDFERITVAVTICVRGANCSSHSSGPEKKILPWRDPCFMNDPCQQREFAVCHPTVDDYSCSCQYRWTGKKCDVPRNMTTMTYKAGRCLDSSSETGVQFLYMKTVEECQSVCLRTKCKAFEFRIMRSSLHGNCTLRDSNSLEHKVVPCDSDLYELKTFSTAGPITNSTVGTPTQDTGLSTVVIVIIVFIGLLLVVFIVIVIVMKPYNLTKPPARSHSNLGALPRGTRPGESEVTPLAQDQV